MAFESVFFFQKIFHHLITLVIFFSKVTLPLDSFCKNQIVVPFEDCILIYFSVQKLENFSSISTVSSVYHHPSPLLFGAVNNDRPMSVNFFFQHWHMRLGVLSNNRPFVTSPETYD
jgi:hypothetical protein